MVDWLLQLGDSQQSYYHTETLVIAEGLRNGIGLVPHGFVVSDEESTVMPTLVELVAEGLIGYLLAL